jgi:hypothetical protein
MTERKVFESWLYDLGMDNKRGSRGYVDPHTQLLWRCWLTAIERHHIGKLTDLQDLMEAEEFPKCLA